MSNIPKPRPRIQIVDDKQALEVILGQIPISNKWHLTPIYKRSVNGGLLIWQVGFNGINRLEMTHGFAQKSSGEEGNIRTDTTEIEGLAGRNLQQQALQEATKRYVDKWREGYRVGGPQPPLFTKPMKGYEYKEGKIKKLENSLIIYFL